jgi:hypothetical protein
MSSLGCCIRWARRPAPFVILLAVVPLLAFFLVAQEPAANQPAPMLEEKYAFPQPLQWRVQNTEVSLIGLAWGPANSPGMIAKGRELTKREQAEFFPDRPYALAVCLRAKFATPITGFLLSGLVRIKNVEGSLEYPMALTSSGFVKPFVVPGGLNDLPFKGSDTAEPCEFFPASPDQKDFLFQLRAPAVAPFSSFRIVVKEDKFVIIRASPGEEGTAGHFTKNFSGTIGAETAVSLQLVARGTELSGTEQYTRIGKTLWLKGKVDSLGNFELQESYPKDQVTGVLRGKFSLGYREMTGYFSKPDGSRLQPFEFREVSNPQAR